MKIHGLQKMTLLDYPGRVACTVFLGGCDFRCPYCHNAELNTGEFPPLMEEEELLSFLKKRQGLLDGVCITGGEPLVHPVAPLLRAIRDLGYAIKLDTNGNHPQKLRELMAEGLVDYVAMDVKNSPARYGQTVGNTEFDTAAVDESIRLLLEGSVDYEFRTTVVEQFHTEEDILAMGEWIRGAKRYFLQPFADRDTVPFAGLCAPGKEKLLRFCDILRPLVQEISLRGE